jgi:hypothetical protein
MSNDAPNTDDLESRDPSLDLFDVPPAKVLAMARLLRPTFLEVRGCVLLPWAYEPNNFEQWWEELDGNRPKIEAVLSHQHLWDIFLIEDEDREEEWLNQLGEVISECWRETLRLRFPNREFDVVFSNTEDDYGPTVMFYSVEKPR